MLKDRLHELLEDSEGVTSESKTNQVIKEADNDGRENEAFDGDENNEGETKDKIADKTVKEKKAEEKLKPKKTKEQIEVDIEALERQKAEEKALEEFIEDHKLSEDLGKFLDDIGKAPFNCYLS